MTTAELKSKDIASDINAMALFAKAAYCRVRPTEDNPNPHSVNTVDGAKEALDNWYPNSGWEVISVNGGINGFQAVAYGRDNVNGKFNEVIIAFRGTDSLLDLAWDDLLIALKIEPTQSKGAIAFYESIMKLETVNNNAKVIITGHSLGGSLAQIVGAETSKTTITFNAPGMLEKVSEGSYDYITNYVNLNDWIGSYGKHVGKTHFYLPDGKTEQGDFSPHSIFVHNNNYYEECKTNITENDWKDISYAASLWGYDVQNSRLGMQQAIASLKASPEKLKEAVYKIQSKVGINNKLEKSFHYLTQTGINYVLGDKECNEIELKRTGLGMHERGVAWGNCGNDTITGLDDEDVLIGGKDSDTIYGGKGNDVLVAGNALHDVDRLYQMWDYRDVVNVTNYTADNSQNSLYGEKGDDLLVGDNGRDYLDGGDDNDYLYGGRGNDVLIGGSGDDHLIGGQDSDTLKGGTGYDTYIINSGDGVDTIYDSSLIQNTDGLGHINFNGNILHGSIMRNPIAGVMWIDSFGNWYLWNGNEGSDLIINGMTIVKNFKNKETLEIYLGKYNEPIPVVCRLGFNPTETIEIEEKRIA